MDSVKEDEESLVAVPSPRGEGDEDEDADEVEETAEVLMTDMTLEDDKIRDSEPGSLWLYHIEVYPWNADDINEHFIRLMKLASFTKLSMRKKPVSHESEDIERIDDKVMERQRKGTLHLYAESYLTAKSIMRHSTWKNMISKELTFEITKRSADTVVKARIDVDTYSLCKVRFRDKTKGSFKARSAKVSNLPTTVTREFLDIVFARSYAAYDGPETELNRDKKEMNLQQTLGNIHEFEGSLDIDCLNRGSCRAFVLAHKTVVIQGNKLSITANDSQTMVVPPEAQSVGIRIKDEKAKMSPMVSTGFTMQMTTARGGGSRDVTHGRTSAFTRMNPPVAHSVQSARVHPMTSMGRARGLGGGRGMVSTQQPASASFTRAGPGMPVPMTGRQKMNEKMRRNHPNAMGFPNSGIYPAMGASGAYRTPTMNSIGDSFKQEIASLQLELERSTQAIEAKIERLKEESSYYNDYNEEMQMYEEGEWDNSGTYEYDVGQEDYFDEGENVYYDVQPHNAMGYQSLYEQPMQQMMPMGRGVIRRWTGQGRGIHPVSSQQTIGFLDNPRVRSSVQARNVRGKGGGGVFQGPGPSGY